MGAGASRLPQNDDARVQFVVNGVRTHPLVHVGGMAGVERFRVLSKYPPDLICQMGEICDETPGCAADAFASLEKAVAARMGGAANVYADTETEAPLDAAGFEAFVTTFREQWCAGGAGKVYNPRSDRYRAQCTLGQYRDPTSQRCRNYDIDEDGVGHRRRRSSSSGRKSPKRRAARKSSSGGKKARKPCKKGKSRSRSTGRCRKPRR